MSLKRAPGSLLVRLLVSYLLPTLTLFGLFAWLAHRTAENSLEQSLGRRLTGIAQAAATQLRPEAVLFLAPGDEDSRTSRRMRHKLEEVRQRTRVARILVLDRDLRSRCDTMESVRIGDRYYHAEADRTELARLFREAREAASVLFAGDDGQFYKTGYAPVLDGGRAVAAVGVEGSAEYFAVLADLRRALVLGGAGVALLVMLASVVVARRITRPLRSLAREAARIGAGEMERPIEVRSRDEVGLLAQTMNEMRGGLHERDTQMQMMLSGIAHEVRNPLGGIELFSGLLRDDLQESGDAEKLEHVQRIERELAYLKKVVADFLDFARRTRPTLARVDLAALVGDVVEVMTKDAADRGVMLDARCEDPAWGQCDIDQIRRVLINLTRNAIQATDAGGRVVLSCGPRDPNVCLTVTDTGRGMEPELIEEIFKPFYTTREKGTGLGLAFAKKIVDEHGGGLEVESTPGEGTRFRVTLPAAREE